MRSMEYLYDDICLIRDDMRDINSGGEGLDGEGENPYSLTVCKVTRLYRL